MRTSNRIHRWKRARLLPRAFAFVLALSILCLPASASAAAPPRTCNVQATANQGGVVSGQGMYQADTTVTLVAEAMEGYSFSGWYESGIRVYNFSVYTFIAATDRTLEARFTAASSRAVPATAQAMAANEPPSQSESSSKASKEESSEPEPEASSQSSQAPEAVSEAEASALSQSSSAPEEEAAAQEESKEDTQDEADVQAADPEPRASLPQTGNGVQSYIVVGVALLATGILCGRRRRRDS